MANRSKTKDTFAGLPFVANRKIAGLPRGRFPRCFWNVKPTGDYSTDEKIGEQFAAAWLKCEATERGWPMLANIVAEMPRELSGIEVGFLGYVGFCARDGIAAGERISKYWDAGVKGSAAAGKVVQ